MLYIYDWQVAYRNDLHYWKMHLTIWKEQKNTKNRKDTKALTDKYQTSSSVSIDRPLWW